MALFLLVITNKSSGDCKTSIRRQKDGQKKVGKLETLGPKNDKIVSSWGFLLASDVPDLELKELTKPEMSMNADQKKPLLFSQRTRKGTAQKDRNSAENNSFSPAEHQIKKSCGPTQPMPSKTK